jgi:hypothetical protein
MAWFKREDINLVFKKYYRLKVTVEDPGVLVLLIKIYSIPKQHIPRHK